jgi:hypothetical protein
MDQLKPAAAEVLKMLMLKNGIMQPKLRKIHKTLWLPP